MLSRPGLEDKREMASGLDACISDHVPDAQKDKENIDAWARAWRQLSANTDRGTVAAACKRHIDQARESMKSFNCDF
jgi:hypothetical protein